MVNKTLATCREAVTSVFDGATILLGGFGDPGLPGQLLEALREQGATNLSIVHNGSGGGTHALGGLIADGRVRKLTASFPNNPGGTSFQDLYLKGEIELELVPQGTLAERIRSAGAGLGGFFTPTAAGTELACTVHDLTMGGAGLSVGTSFGVPPVFRLTIDGDRAEAKGRASLDRNAFGVGQGEFAGTDQIPGKVTVEIDVKAKRAP